MNRKWYHHVNNFIWESHQVCKTMTRNNLFEYPGVAQIFTVWEKSNAAFQHVGAINIPRVLDTVGITRQFQLAGETSHGIVGRVAHFWTRVTY